MKKLYFSLITFLSLGSLLQAQTYQNNVPKGTVDGISRISGCGFGTQPGVQMSNIVVPVMGNIADPSKITVNLSLNASWVGDVVIELVSPSGEAITLIRRLGALSNGSCGDSSSFIPTNILGFNSANVNLIDAAAVGVGVGIPAGNYLPTYSFASFPKHHPANMATFMQGRQLNGEWRLIIYDYGLGELSNINSWQMVIGAGAVLKTGEAGTFGSEISVKQNPVADYLRVDVTNEFKSLNLEIYDASGKKVKNENISRNAKDIELDVRSLTPGMYLLTPVKDGERKQAIKFIKK